MDDVEQPRNQDGRYSEFRRQRVASSPQNEAMASFVFPPMFDSADEYIAFYRSVPIPEQVLSNARFAFEDHLYTQMNDYVSACILNDNVRVNGTDKKDSEWRVWYSDIDEGEYARLKGEEWKEQMEEQSNPLALPLSWTEDIVRAGWMFRNSTGLLEEDYEKIDSEEFIFFNDRENKFPITVKDIVERYQTRAWINDAVQHTDLRVAKAMERMSDRGLPKL